jgi:prolyl-tRNA synthetase
MFWPTLKEAPHDAEALSHKLMVRAGLVRQLGSGLWSYLPVGWRVHRRVEDILREEMEAIGAQEISMPVLQPAEIWKQTGRYGITEMFYLDDRKGSPMVLAMTHEEALTYHVAREVRSYRDLPQILFHIQNKDRDEPRPRAGVLRTREFRMKDSYSFDCDEEGLEVSYEKHSQAYARIFDRCGLRWYRVDSDVGMMGGAGAHEYMAPCAAGEDSVVLAGSYAANLEIASAEPQPVELPAPLPAPEAVDTPGLVTVEEVSAHLGVAEGALIKAMPVVADEGGFTLVLLRGDHRLAETKLKNRIGPFRPAAADEIEAHLGPVGFVGPVNPLKPGFRVLKDAAIQGNSFVTGANRPDQHLRGVEPGRDFSFEEVDVREVNPGDRVDGVEVTIEPVIEIGNIFKLGTRYSEPLGATFLDASGKERPIVMGSYGIGPARIIAAAIEQRADDRGINWPKSLAPWQVHLVVLGKEDGPERDEADRIYEELRSQGLEAIYDDRDAGPGEKLTDAELLGCPLRLVVGRKGLAEGRVEAEERASGERHSLALETVVQEAVALVSGLGDDA